MTYYNTTALGDQTAPTREEIEDAVLDFDDANNAWSATVRFYPGGEYEITVKSDEVPRQVSQHFDRLYEFRAWVFEQEKALDLDEELAAMVLGEARNKINEPNWARIVEGATK
jgi:hypothetical protein